MAAPSAFSGNIPANYEKYLGPVLFEPYAIDLAERVAKARPSKVLEVACGTGRVTSKLLSSVPSLQDLTATDINEDMLAVAKSVVTDERVVWQAADAQKLPFAENSFDAVVCQFGIMFLQDKLVGIQEMNRVVKVGGSLFFNTWASLEENPRAGLTVKAVKAVLKDEAPDFLEKGPYSMFREEEIKQLLHGAGFTSVKYDRVRKMSTYPDLHSLVHGIVDGSPLSSFLLKFPDEKRLELYDEIRSEFSKLGEPEALQNPMAAWVFEAVKTHH